MKVKSTLRPIFLAVSSALLLASCNENAQSLVNSPESGMVHVAPRIANAAIPAGTKTVKATLVCEGKTTYAQENYQGSNDSLVLSDVPKGSDYRLVLVGKADADAVLWGADTTVKAATSDVTLMSLFTADAIAKPVLQGGAATSVSPSVSDTTLLFGDVAANRQIYYTINGAKPIAYSSAGIVLSKGALAADTLRAYVVAQLGSDSLVSKDTATIVVKYPSTPSKSTDTTLSDLKVATGSLTPKFSPKVTSYTDTIASTATSETITAIANASNAKISGDTGVFSVAELLTGGSTVKKITVTNNGKSLVYTVTIVKAKVTPTQTAIDTTLTSLSTTPGKFKETFAAGTKVYTDTVDDTATKLTVSATAKVSTNSISYNGGTSSTIALTSTTPASILVKVTNANTNSLTYTINLVRRSTTTTPTAIDTILTSLSTAPGKLKETFASGTTTYTDTVDDTVTKLIVHAKAKVTANTITYNGKSDSAIALTSTTPASILVKVTNANTNSLTYTINLVRRSTVVATVDSTLSALAVDAGTLTPSFDAGILSYTDTIDTSTTKSVTVSATAADPKGLVWFGGVKSTHTATKSVTAFPSTLTVSAVVGNSSTDYTINFVVKSAGSGTSIATGSGAVSLTQGTKYTVSNTCSGKVAFKKDWDATDQGAINVLIDDVLQTGSYYLAVSASSTFTLVSNLAGTSITCE